MLSPDDKRDFQRINLECPASFRIIGEDTDVPAGAIVKDLSAGGLLIHIERDIPTDSLLSIEVMPVNTITPSLKAEVKVLRCLPIEGAEGSFAVACQIQRLLD